jgi:pimeloyl-ACP methyl ester carboxylesterase
MVIDPLNGEDTIMRNPHIDAHYLPGRNRRVAVLIHGIAGSANTFCHTRTHLERRGYDTIAIDLTGHGRADRRPDYHFAYWTEEILSVIDALDDTPDLIVGHSMGGLLAAGVAPIAQPRQLILIDPLFTTMRPLNKFVGERMVRRNARDAAHPNHNGNGQWDERTLQSLQNEAGQRILNRFYASTIPARTWIIRPPGSRLVPTSVLPTLRAAGVTVIAHPTRTHFPHFVNPDHVHATLDAILAA